MLQPIGILSDGAFVSFRRSHLVYHGSEWKNGVVTSLIYPAFSPKARS
jgi:hypothetical protein